MATTQAQKDAINRYISSTFDDIKLRVPKGKRDEYKRIVADLGYKSFNAFMIAAMDEKIQREKNDQ